MYNRRRMPEVDRITENLDKAVKIQRRVKIKTTKIASELGFHEELTSKSKLMLERMVSDGKITPETTESGLEASRDLLYQAEQLESAWGSTKIPESLTSQGTAAFAVSSVIN